MASTYPAVPKMSCQWSALATTSATTRGPGCASTPSLIRALRAPSDTETESESSQVSSRRAAVLAATLFPLVSAVANVGVSSHANAAAEIATSKQFAKDPSFYARWQYAQPSDIVPFVLATATAGDPQSVLTAMDEFGRYYPMYKLGDEKGAMLAKLVRDRNPIRCVEVGTFLGYSAIWTALQLSPGASLICVEFEQRHVDVARRLIDFAGVSDVVTILQGSGQDRVPDVVSKLGRNTPADFVFFDHCKQCYLPDLVLFENAGLIKANTVVVADNVVYPGAPDFLEYVATSAGRYETTLLDAQFEYDQVWNKDWVPQRDALSFSTRLEEARE